MLPKAVVRNEREEEIVLFRHQRNSSIALLIKRFSQLSKAEGNLWTKVVKEKHTAAVPEGIVLRRSLMHTLYAEAMLLSHYQGNFKSLI